MRSLLVEAGDLVVFSKNYRINFFNEVKENEKYVVLGIDNEDNSPIIDIGKGKYHFLFSRDMNHVKEFEKSKDISMLHEALSRHEYIPPNFSVEELLIKSEFANLMRYKELAIDIALDKKDEKLFKYVMENF